MSEALALQLGEIPSSFAARFSKALSGLGVCGDGTGVVHAQRESKSDWELACMEEAAGVQVRMFEAVEAVGGEGVSELDLAGRAEAVSRCEGFAGQVEMRRYPLQCDRAVVVSGALAASLPSSTPPLVALAHIRCRAWEQGLPK